MYKRDPARVHVGFFRFQLLFEKEIAMSKALDQEYAHLGETRGMKDHDHDLIHDLSRRLDCL